MERIPQVVRRERRLELAAAVMLAALSGVHAIAAPIYRCVDASGHVAFQDAACTDPQRAAQVEMPPAPPPAASPRYAMPSREPVLHPLAIRRLPHAAPRGPLSYECRAADGEVFYRHSACPKTIRNETSPRRSRAKGVASTPVTGTALPRSEACRRMAASTARAGHERDDQVGAYEHNLGRDPCRDA